MSAVLVDPEVCAELVGAETVGAVLVNVEIVCTVLVGVEIVCTVPMDAMPVLLVGKACAPKVALNWKPKDADTQALSVHP